ncbi:MAG: hypothetical protein ABL883_07210 [Terricaulis sp.]
MQRYDTILPRTVDLPLIDAAELAPDCEEGFAEFTSSATDSAYVRISGGDASRIVNAYYEMLESRGWGVTSPPLLARTPAERTCEDNLIVLNKPIFATGDTSHSVGYCVAFIVVPSAECGTNAR